MIGKIKDPEFYFWLKTSWPSMVCVTKGIKRKSASKGYASITAIKRHPRISQGGGNGCIR
ncbi:MAG: hypothetical protein AB1480_16880 [Nitrospirota bacterium]